MINRLGDINTTDTAPNNRAVVDHHGNLIGVNVDRRPIRNPNLTPNPTPQRQRNQQNNANIRNVQNIGVITPVNPLNTDIILPVGRGNGGGVGGYQIPELPPIKKPYLLYFVCFIMLIIIIYLWMQTNKSSSKVSSNEKQAVVPDQQSAEQLFQIEDITDISVVKVLQDRFEKIPIIQINDFESNNIAVCALFKVPRNNPRNEKINVKMGIYRDGRSVSYQIFEHVPKYGMGCFRLPKVSTPGEYEVQLWVLDKRASTVFTLIEPKLDMPAIAYAPPQQRQDGVRNIQQNKQQNTEQEYKSTVKERKAKNTNESIRDTKEINTWDEAHRGVVYLDE